VADYSIISACDSSLECASRRGGTCRSRIVQIFRLCTYEVATYPIVFCPASTRARAQHAISLPNSVAWVVIPHLMRNPERRLFWIPAFAGMTNYRTSLGTTLACRRASVWHKQTSFVQAQGPGRKSKSRRHRHYRLYLPISWPCARMCPCMALTRPCLLAPAGRSSCVSRA
jgi:hypothetical protein